MIVLPSARAKKLHKGRVIEYEQRKRGIAVKVRRCRQINYTDKNTRKKENPTCIQEKTYTYSQPSLECYENASYLLKQLAKVRKKKPTTTRDRILSAIACNREVEKGKATGKPIPISAGMISAVTGDSLNATRRTMENLVKSGRVNCFSRLETLEEKQCTLPPAYDKAFNEFIKKEPQEKTWAGFRRLFGDKYVPAGKVSELPEPLHM